MKHPFVEESDSEDTPEFDDLDEIEIEKFRLNIVPSLLRRNLPLSLSELLASIFKQIRNDNGNLMFFRSVL